MMIGKTYSGELRKMRLWIIYWEFTVGFVVSYVYALSRSGACWRLDSGSQIFSDDG